MPEYVANPQYDGVLMYKGKVVKTGDVMTLTEEQAEQLKLKVVPVAVANPVKPFSEMTVKELSPLAKQAGVPAYSTLNRSELVSTLEGLSPDSEAVSNDGSSSD